MADEVEIRIKAKMDDLNSQLKVATENLKRYEEATGNANSATKGWDVVVAGLKARIEGLETQIRQLGGTLGDPFKNLAAAVQESAGKVDATTESIRKSLEGVGTAANAAGIQIKTGWTGTEEVATKAAQGMHGLRFATAGASRELIVLGHEVLQGNFSRIPGSLMVLSERMGGLSMSFLAAAAPIAIVTALVGYFTIKAIELSQAVDKIKIGADFAANADITSTAIRSTVKDVSHMAHMTVASAEEVVGAYARMRNMSTTELKGMSAATVEFAQVTGTDAKAAVNALTGFFEEENVSLKKLTEMFPGATMAQKEHFLEIQRSANANEIWAAKLELVGTNLDRTKDSVIKANAALYSNYENLLKLIPGVEWFISIQDLENHAIERSTKRWEDNAAAIKKAAAEKAATPLTHDEILGAGAEASKAMDPYKEQINKTNVDIKKLKDAITELGKASNGAPDTDKIKEYSVDLKVAEGNLARLKEQQRKRADTPNQLGGADAISKAREAISDIMMDEEKSASERLTAVQGVWQKVLDGEKMTAVQRRLVVEAMNKSIAQAERAVSSERVANAKLAIAEIQSDEDVSATEKKQQTIQLWDFLLAGDDLTARTRVEIETARAKALRDLHREELNEAYAEADEYRRIQELKLRDRRAASVIMRAQITEEEADIKEIGRQEAADKKRVLDEMLGYEQQFVQNVLSGRMSLQGSLLRLAGQFIEKELANDLKYLTARLMYNDVELREMYKQGLGGLLFHTKVETGKTAATAMSAAARETIGAEEAAVGVATQAASQEVSILNSAKTAAAGAYSALAGIPYIGPIIAPIAAGAAFVAVEAYGQLASLDTGTMEVPKDMTANIHKGEMVVPKPFADSVRSSDFFGGANPKAGHAVHFDYSPTINAPERPTLPQLIEKDANFMRSWIHAELRAGALKVDTR